MASLECEPLESKLQVNVFAERHSMALLEKKRLKKEARKDMEHTSKHAYDYLYEERQDDI